MIRNTMRHVRSLLSLCIRISYFFLLRNQGAPRRTRVIERFLCVLALSSLAGPVKALTADPVLFVHGLRSDAGAWADLGVTLSSAGWTFGGFPELNRDTGLVDGAFAGDFYLMNFSDADSPDCPSQDLPLSSRAYEIGRVIDAILQSNPGEERVTVVGHSLGGLAARAYLQGLALSYSGDIVLFANDVGRLITIGTPHLGAELAVVCIELGSLCEEAEIYPECPSISELPPDSTIMLEFNNLVDWPLPFTVRYESLIGIGRTVWGTDEDGDGLVTAYSQNLGQLAGAGLLDHYQESIWVIEEPFCDLGVPQRHTCETQDLGAQAEILQRIPTGSGELPAVQTEPATVAESSATLDSTIEPGGLSTSGWFVWEKNNPAPVENEDPVPHAEIGSGSSPVEFSWTIDELDCESTYFYFAAAENSIGVAHGDTLSFTTGDCGAVGTSEIEYIANGDFEQGLVAWNRLLDFYIDDASFPRSGVQYAFVSGPPPDYLPGNDLLGFLRSDSIHVPSGADDATLSFWYSISSEETGPDEFDKLHIWLIGSEDEVLHTYDYLSNLDQTGNGVYAYWSEPVPAEALGRVMQVMFIGHTDQSAPTVFRVDDVSLVATLPDGGPPSVATEFADQVTESSARLSMTVDPNEAPTSAWFAWDDDQNLSFETDHQTVGSTGGPQTFSQTLTDLDCDTRYYFEAVAENAHGQDVGSRRSFDTDSCSGGEPIADTDPANEITQEAAILTAEIYPNGFPTDAWFEWGLTPTLGSATPIGSVGSGTSWQDFQAEIDGLTCETTYYYAARAENQAGDDTGATASFSTVSCGAPAVSDELLLWVSRQGCSGTSPAVLFGWTMPPSTDPLVTLRRTDGLAVATVNTAVTGPMYVVDLGLVPGGSYEFRLEATVNDELRSSNTVSVYAYASECHLSVGGGDVPHLPVAWVEPAECVDGAPEIRVRWTDVLGAESYTVHRDGLFNVPSASFSGLSGLSLDDEIAPGQLVRYKVDAVNAAGIRESFFVGAMVPGTTCDDPGHPGTFTASSSPPYCNGGTGALDIEWTEASDAEEDYRTFTFDEHEFKTGSDNEDNFLYQASNLTPGAVARIVVQAQSNIDLDQFREAEPIAAFVEGDVCGPPSEPPRASSSESWYVEESQAYLRSSTIPKGSETTAYFEYGLDTNYGMTTPIRNVGDGFDFVTVGEVVSDLSCNTTYHFRFVATNAIGTNTSDDEVFTTDPCSNAAPTAGDDGYLGQENISLLVGPEEGVLGNDSDPDGDPLEAQLVSAPSDGVLTLQGDGSFEYMPNPDFFGVDSFTYQASDGLAVSNLATVEILVEFVVEPPPALIFEDGFESGDTSVWSETVNPN